MQLSGMYYQTLSLAGEATIGIEGWCFVELYLCYVVDLPPTPSLLLGIRTQRIGNGGLLVLDGL